MKIVSLVPSQTELLYTLGLNDEVVGITKFCIHPHHWFKTKKRVGGTKQLHLDDIEAIQPDLIIANKEENTKEDIEFLQKKYTVYVSDITTYDDAIAMIVEVGKLVNKRKEAEQLVEQIHFEKNKVVSQKTQKVIYFIWQKPFMVAGSDTFIHSMLQIAGFQNCVLNTRYPEISIEEINQLNPDYLLLSSEPFPFKEMQVAEFEKIFPSIKIKLVDGELFSWYGSRMLQSFQYFSKLNEELSA